MQIKVGLIFLVTLLFLACFCRWHFNYIAGGSSKKISDDEDMQPKVKKGLGVQPGKVRIRFWVCSTFRVCSKMHGPKGLKMTLHFFLSE